VKAGRHTYRRRSDVEDNTEIDLLAATNTTMEIYKDVNIDLNKYMYVRA